MNVNKGKSNVVKPSDAIPGKVYTGPFFPGMYLLCVKDTLIANNIHTRPYYKGRFVDLVTGVLKRPSSMRELYEVDVVAEIQNRGNF